MKVRLHRFLIKMETKTRNRKGLSQVVTTLILLVVAVLLVGVVSYYATNVIMVRTAQEQVRIAKHHIWVSEDDKAYAAFVIQNLGSRDILLDKITVRGVDNEWIRTSGREYQITGESLVASPDGSQISFTGSLANNLIKEGTLTITDGTETFIEAVPPDGTLTGSSGTGTINYITGVYKVTFGSAPTVAITADYDYAEGLNHYYLVQPEDDVSGDFELSEDASFKVYAHIGSVPASLAFWNTPGTDMALKSSGTMLFYIEDPVNIGLQDVGTTISLTVFTSNAQWIVETNVEAAVIEPFP